jgi:hypothetical protein
MRHLRTLLPVACVAIMLLASAPATAEVVWDHELTDPAGDVISVLDPANPVSGQEGVDILSASVADQGDDVNVTLSLGGHYDSDATYQVTVVTDGDEAREYTFTYNFGFFSINGFDLVEDDPSSFISADGKLVSWVVAKDKITAAEKLEVTGAQASVFGGISNYVDTAPDSGGGNGGGNGGGGGVEPLSILRTVEVIDLTHVQVTTDEVVSGDDAKSLRGEFDTDVDGSVSQAEYDQHIGFFLLEYITWNGTDMTLDDQDADRTVLKVEFLGIIGTTTSTAPVTKRVVLDIWFPEVEKATSHKYEGDMSGGDEVGDLWHVTSDSQWLMTLPSDWKFETRGFHPDLIAYLNEEDTKITIPGTDMQTNWNASMGGMEGLFIEKRTGGDDSDGDGDSPGFSAVLVVAGVLVAVIVTAVRRRH